MLARNAEALYWIGRYVERADDTARILDVAVHQLLEDSSVDPDQASRLLLRVLGIEPPDHELDVWSLTDLVAFSTNSQGGSSIVDAISAARENAKSAREVTSSETWECLNTTYNALPERERAAKRLGPHEFLSFIEGRAAMFAGLADSTLRDRPMIGRGHPDCHAVAIPSWACGVFVHLDRWWCRQIGVVGDPIADVVTECLQRRLHHFGGARRSDDRQGRGISSEVGDPTGDKHVAELGDMVAV